MVTKTDTDFELVVDGGGSEFLTGGRENLVTPEKPTPTTVFFYPLPTYEQDRRHDARSRDTINKQQFPYKSGFLERFEQTADPGWYFVEFRAVNQIVGGEPYEVKATGRAVIQSQGNRQLQQLAQAGQAATQTETPANAVNSVTDAVRAVKDLQKELTPAAPVAAPVTAADIERIADERAARAVEQYKATQLAAPVAAPLDPLKMVREVAALQRELAPPAQTAAATPDAAESFLSQFEKFTEISERINPIRERDNAERGWFDKVLGTVEGLAKSAPALAQFAPLIVGMMPGRMGAMMESAGITDAPPPGAPMPPQQPGAQPTPQQPTTATQPAAPQSPEEAFIFIAHVAVADMTKGKRVGRVADLVEENLVKFPQLRKAVNEICEMPPEQALMAVQQLTGRNDLASYATSLPYVEDLQNELMPGDDGNESDGEDQAGVPSIVEMASAQTN